MYCTTYRNKCFLEYSRTTPYLDNSSLYSYSTRYSEDSMNVSHDAEAELKSNFSEKKGKRL